jgi:hypothetical protein
LCLSIRQIKNLPPLTIVRDERFGNPIHPWYHPHFRMKITSLLEVHQQFCSYG